MIDEDSMIALYIASLGVMMLIVLELLQVQSEGYKYFKSVHYNWTDIINIVCFVIFSLIKGGLYTINSDN